MKTKTWFGESWSQLTSRISMISSSIPPIAAVLTKQASAQEVEPKKPRLPSKVILDGRSRKPAIFQAPSGAHLTTTENNDQ